MFFKHRLVRSTIPQIGEFCKTRTTKTKKKLRVPESSGGPKIQFCLFYRSEPPLQLSATLRDFFLFFYFFIFLNIFFFFFFSFFFFLRHNGPASAAPCQEGHFWKRSETKKRILRVAQKTQIRAALQELLESLPCFDAIRSKKSLRCKKYLYGIKERYDKEKSV